MGRVLLALLLALGLAWGAPAGAVELPVPPDLSGARLGAVELVAVAVGDAARGDFVLAEDVARREAAAHLAARGLDVPGSDSLFAERAMAEQQGEREAAPYHLAGRVSRVDCVRSAAGVACEALIDWELLDVGRDAVVYATRTRGYAEAWRRTRMTTEMASEALARSLDSLLARPAFLAALAPSGEGAPEAVALHQDPADESQLGDKPDFITPRREPLTPRQRRIRTGAVVGGTGLVLGGGSYALYLTDPQVDRAGWTGLQVGNALGWTAVAGGAALLTAGLLTRPQAALAVGLGPGSVTLGGRF